MTDSAMPIAPITLPQVQHPEKEEKWLEQSLHTWLDEEFLPEAINGKIAQRASKDFRTSTNGGRERSWFFGYCHYCRNAIV